MQLLFFFQFRW